MDFLGGCFFFLAWLSPSEVSFMTFCLLSWEAYASWGPYFNITPAKNFPRDRFIYLRQVLVSLGIKRKTMKCYYHIQIEAVGKCKNCQKGICRECAIDVGNGIACGGNCEDEVRAVNEHMKLKMTEQQRAYSVQSKNAIWSILAGAVCLFTGLANASGGPLLVAMGVMLFLTAILQYSIGRKFLAK
jgi:hypothetical protein